mmetsp:Transcript_9082/g.13988  ORF Transcript_9082/g.13988 Transcript_9082/m.13988 type:complete len:257 (-) Transcript_9082:148-918(-)
MSSSGLSRVFKEIVLKRRSVRNFREDAPIASDVLGELLALTQRSPSSFNMQPWRCIIVRNEEQRELMSRAMLSESNRRRVIQAPMTAVFLADLEPAHLIPKVLELEQDRLPKSALENIRLGAAYYASSGIVLSALKGIFAKAASPLVPMPFPERANEWATKSAMLAAQTFILAAQSHELVTAPMEGFDAERLRLYLRVPERFSLPLIIATGYPARDDEQIQMNNGRLSPRFPPDSVFSGDVFDAPLKDVFVPGLHE